MSDDASGRGRVPAAASSAQPSAQRAVGERRQSELAWHGAISPPRKNGELQFAELWESRVFGLTMSLYEAGAFGWGEFQVELIEAIAGWERVHGTSGEGYRYWERWLEAFEALAARKQLLAREALEARVAELAARPAGWDHE